jgi:hypothetical protein
MGRPETMTAAIAAARNAAQQNPYAGVLAAAVAGVVHNAASQGTLQSEQLRIELLKLVDSYLQT